MIENEFIKIAGEIAGIGGLALGVVVMIFRKVLSLKIFPQLNRKDTYKLLNTIIVLSFTAMVFGLAAWLYKGDNNKISKNELTTGDSISSERSINIDNNNGHIGNVINGDNTKINSVQTDTLTKK